jgi:hypothetical protein
MIFRKRGGSQLEEVEKALKEGGIKEYGPLSSILIVVWDHTNSWYGGWYGGKSMEVGMEGCSGSHAPYDY